MHIEDIIVNFLMYYKNQYIGLENMRFYMLR